MGSYNGKERAISSRNTHITRAEGKNFPSNLIVPFLNQK
jgi:hypothetical protein